MHAYMQALSKSVADSFAVMIERVKLSVNSRTESWIFYQNPLSMDYTWLVSCKTLFLQCSYKLLLQYTLLLNWLSLCWGKCFILSERFNQDPLEAFLQETESYRGGRSEYRSEYRFLQNTSWPVIAMGELEAAMHWILILRKELTERNSNLSNNFVKMY